MLIEPTQPVNLGTDEHPQIIHLAQLLSKEEKKEFTELLQEKKINFAWTYSDMPGLDLDLIMHHLSIAPNTKNVKNNLGKMHPHVALLIKLEF